MCPLIKFTCDSRNSDPQGPYCNSKGFLFLKMMLYSSLLSEAQKRICPPKQKSTLWFLFFIFELCIIEERSTKARHKGTLLQSWGSQHMRIVMSITPSLGTRWLPGSLGSETLIPRNKNKWKKWKSGEGERKGRWRKGKREGRRREKEERSQHKHVGWTFTLFFTCGKWPCPEHFHTYSFLLTKNFKYLKNVHDFAITEVFMVYFPLDVIMAFGLLP